MNRHFGVAGVRHCTQGKIHISAFPSEINTFNWKSSSFSYRKTSSRTFRLLEPPASKLLSPENKTVLSGVSLITEIELQ
jgi:hypothetical protein